MKALSVRLDRRLPAPVDRVWHAWTQADIVQQWWGPPGTTCSRVELDLRPGGAYLIENRLPDGSQVTITGTFEAVEPMRRLVYSWRTVEGAAPERVTVLFQADGTGTRVSVHHEHVADEPHRAGHEVGWNGCLDGLQTLLER